MKVFVFSKDGCISIGTVAEEFDIKEQAIRCVPDGVPFLILEDTDLPNGIDTPAWEVDFTNPDGYGTHVETEPILTRGYAQ